jgi:hypothetical protein
MANEYTLEQLSPATVLSYARDLETINIDLQPARALLDELFPEQTIDSLTWEYLKGANRRPVMARVTAWDAEAPVASRRTHGGKVQGDIPKISRKIPLGEKELILLNRMRQNAALPSEIQDFLNANYDDITNMRDAVKARVYEFCFSLLYQTDLTVAENGVILTVEDIGVPAANLKTPVKLWSDPTADILGDIQGWLAPLKTAGINTANYRVLTGETVVANMLKNDAIREMILGRNYSGAPMRPIMQVELDNFLAALGLPKIRTINVAADVQNEDGTYTTKTLFPQDKFTLLPPGRLGQTLYGPTAEAIEQAGAGVINANQVSGIWAGQYKTTDPVNQWTKAVAAAFPTFPTADRVVTADVL